MNSKKVNWRDNSIYLMHFVAVALGVFCLSLVFFSGVHKIQESRHIDMKLSDLDLSELGEINASLFLGVILISLAYFVGLGMFIGLNIGYMREREIKIRGVCKCHK